MSDLRTTEHAMAGFIVILVVVVLGGLWVIHHSTVETQITMNQEAAAKAGGRPIPLDGQLASGSDTPPTDYSVERPAEPFMDFGWVSDFLRRVKAFFMPANTDEPAAPALPSPLETEIMFDRTPPARTDPTDDDSQVLAWRNPPSGVHPKAGYVLKMTAPGLEIAQVKVVSVVREVNQTVWILKADGPDFDVLQDVISHRPKHLKITIQKQDQAARGLERLGSISAAKRS